MELQLRYLSFLRDKNSHKTLAPPCSGCVGLRAASADTKHRGEQNSDGSERAALVGDSYHGDRCTSSPVVVAMARLDVKAPRKMVRKPPGAVAVATGVGEGWVFLKEAEVSEQAEVVLP